MSVVMKQSNIIDFPVVATPQGNNEWYTPSRYIEAARTVMGSIDLDPASCELANKTVKATRYYDILANGLDKPWHGNIWLNPPFGKVENKSGIRIFTNKLIQEYREGRVQQAILLGTSDCDASWFHPLWDFLICFPDHNVYFNRPTITGNVEKEARHGHWFGTTFVYLGTREQKFIEVFSQFGNIAKRVSQPRHIIATPSLWEGQL